MGEVKNDFIIVGLNYFNYCLVSGNALVNKNWTRN